MQKIINTILTFCFCILLSTQALALGDISHKRFLDRPEVHAFIDEMVQKHKFSRLELQRYFAKAKLQDGVLNAISRPYEAKPWHQYRNLFITDSHINNGLRFWKKYAAILEKAEKTYGVPAEIIIAILGVETRYGENTGRFPVFDSLSTLAFEYPPRAPFFRSELEQYLLLSREEGLDPMVIKGSYAGAMGTPQFISSSYRRYAIDFTGSGKRDLLHSTEDAIGSVANYFKEHGWKAGEPVAIATEVSGKGYLQEEWSAKHPKPRHSGSELSKLGVKIQNPAWNDAKIALISLEGVDAPEFWLGFNNFYVITRYNNSSNYAMAVYQLSENLKNANKL
jgi:membrane-bound lytic murein transglycosylase B